MGPSAGTPWPAGAVVPEASQLRQTDTPTGGYRGGPLSDPSLELPFLASFTANGDKPYGDTKSPTNTDGNGAQQRATTNRPNTGQAGHAPPNSATQKPHRAHHVP